VTASPMLRCKLTAFLTDRPYHPQDGVPTHRSLSLMGRRVKQRTTCGGSAHWSHRSTPVIRRAPLVWLLDQASARLLAASQRRPRLRLGLFRPCGLCASLAFLFQIALCLFQRWQGQFWLRSGAGTSLIGSVESEELSDVRMGAASVSICRPLAVTLARSAWAGDVKSRAGCRSSLRPAPP
jgi:hypothetical protein